MNPRVKKVKPKEDYILEVEFTNNSKGIFDINPYLNFGIFHELKNGEYFKKVKCVGGSIAWPHGQDICPDTVFMLRKPVHRKSKKNK